MSNVLLMNENYAHSSIYQAFTYSSQVASLPATNVLDKIRRSKKWRSAGYWDITTSNRGIVIQETIGVNLTATIGVAEYTTDSSFLTAIKTALDAVGDSTYTVTRDTTTNKIKITSNGSGGGGVFRLMWTNASSTAYSILGFDNSADDTGALTYTADTLKIHTLEWLKFDLGVASLPQAVAIVGPIEGLNLTSSAVVKLEGNATDVWTSPTFSVTLDYNEDAMGSFNESGLHTTGLRYWRLTINDPSNTDGYIELSKIFLGEVFTPTQGAAQFPLKTGFNSKSNLGVSDFGTVFSAIKPTSHSFDLSWFGLTKTEVEELIDHIEYYSTDYPFWLALDPNEVFSTAKERWIKFVRFASLPSVDLISPNVFSSQWQLQEEM